MDAPAQYPSAPPQPPGPVLPSAIPGNSAAEEQPPSKGKLSRHLHGHVPLSPGGTSKLSNAVYLSDSHRALLEALVFRMTEGGTWIAITGPAQIGKTVLVQAALTLLPPDKLHLFQVRHSGPGPLSLKSVLSQILDTAEPDAVTSRDLDRANENLFLASARGGHAVLLIDDAQDLAADALRYLLALASHPEAAKLRLQVVLAGRPELWATLQHHEFKPLRDKLALRLTLDRLRPGEDQSYVERRLWVAGTSIRRAITQPALQEIVRFGAGIPGNIDQLLDHAAELRRQRGESRITVRTARAAVAALTGAEPVRRRQGLWVAGAGAFLVLACAVAVFVLLAPALENQGPSSPLPAPSAPAAPPQPPSQAQAAANTATPAPVTPPASPAPAPPQGAAGPTKLADANLAALDGNQPPPSPPPQPSNSEADASKPETTAAAPASSQEAPTAETTAAASPAKPAAEEAPASPPGQAPAAQQPPEPAATASAQPDANQDAPNPPSPAQPQATEAAEAASPPAEPAPTDQIAPKAEAQPQNQPGPVQQQEAISPAPPAEGTRADQKPVELAAARPIAAPPEAPAQPAPAPQSEAAKPLSAPLKLAPDLIAALIRRGDAMLATGDISAARLLYEPAAEAGNGPAAAALGRTFDPAFLTSIGTIGIRPDPNAAAKWYRKAASLGEPGMEDAIKRLELLPATANASSGGR